MFYSIAQSALVILLEFRQLPQLIISCSDNLMDKFIKPHVPRACYPTLNLVQHMVTRNSNINLLFCRLRCNLNNIGYIVLKVYSSVALGSPLFVMLLCFSANNNKLRTPFTNYFYKDWNGRQRVTKPVGRKHIGRILRPPLWGKSNVYIPVTEITGEDATIDIKPLWRITVPSMCVISRSQLQHTRFSSPQVKDYQCRQGAEQTVVERAHYMVLISPTQYSLWSDPMDID